MSVLVPILSQLPIYHGVYCIFFLDNTVLIQLPTTNSPATTHISLTQPSHGMYKSDVILGDFYRQNWRP